MNLKPLPGGLLALALAHSAHAIDLHPLESMQLAAGVYEFDNIIIPAEVAVTFVGNPMEMILRAAHDIRIDGSLIGPGWNLTLEAGEIIVLNTSGSLEFAAGNIALIGHASLLGDPLVSPGNARIEAGARLCVSGYCDASITSKPSANARLDVIRGGEITLHASPIFEGLLPSTTIGSEITILPSPSPVALTPAVPEPETWAMLLAGLGLVGWHARRGR